jgi:hypothetical protein
MTRAVAGAAGAAKKAAPAKKAARPPSSRGYMDAVVKGGEKQPTTAPPPAPAPETPTPVSPAPPAPPAWADTGAGVLLAFVFWTWVAVPFLKAGPGAVKTIIKAKFTNKAPDGSWLP